MSFGKLNTHVFINNITASIASSWYPVDWVYGMNNERSISGSKTATSADEVVLELRTLVLNSGTTVADVISTATTWPSTAASFSAVIVGPYTHIRVRKVGASGAATVVGVV
jgi:hypothetical protein